LHRSLRTRLPPASGADLVREVVSSRYFAAIPTWLLSCVSAVR